MCCVCDYRFRCVLQARFILAKIKGEIVMENKRKAAIVDQLIKKGAGFIYRDCYLKPKSSCNCFVVVGLLRQLYQLPLLPLKTV